MPIIKPEEMEVPSPTLPELLAEVRTELAAIRRERAKLEEREDALSITLTTIVGLARRMPAKTSKPSADEKELPLLAAAIRFLESQGRPMGTSEINDYLFQQGRHESKKALYQTLWSALSVDAEKDSSPLVKEGSKWGLRAWASSPATPSQPVSPSLVADLE